MPKKDKLPLNSNPSKSPQKKQTSLKNYLKGILDKTSKIKLTFQDEKNHAESEEEPYQKNMKEKESEKEEKGKEKEKEPDKKNVYESTETTLSSTYNNSDSSPNSSPIEYYQHLLALDLDDAPDVDTSATLKPPSDAKLKRRSIILRSLGGKKNQISPDTVLHLLSESFEMDASSDSTSSSSDSGSDCDKRYWSEVDREDDERNKIKVTKKKRSPSLTSHRLSVQPLQLSCKSSSTLLKKNNSDLRRRTISITGNNKNSCLEIKRKPPKDKPNIQEIKKSFGEKLAALKEKEAEIDVTRLTIEMLDATSRKHSAPNLAYLTLPTLPMLPKTDSTTDCSEISDPSNSARTSDYSHSDAPSSSCRTSDGSHSDAPSSNCRTSDGSDIYFFQSLDSARTSVGSQFFGIDFEPDEENIPDKSSREEAKINNKSKLRNSKKNGVSSIWTTNTPREGSTRLQQSGFIPPKSKIKPRNNQSCKHSLFSVNPLKTSEKPEPAKKNKGKSKHSKTKKKPSMSK